MIRVRIGVMLGFAAGIGTPVLAQRDAGIVLDVAWALFEIRAHRSPDLSPNQVWTALTATTSAFVPTPSGPGGP